MELVFVCRKTNQVFRRKDYTIIANRGVKNTADGHRELDADVQLDQLCPFCGRRHVYHVSEPACPFSEPDAR